MSNGIPIHKLSTEEKVFQAISNHPEYTLEMIREKVNIKSSDFNKAINVLKEKGWLSEIKILVPSNRVKASRIDNSEA